MIVVAIVRRRLREGKTYEDFRRVWFHETGFGTDNRMFSCLNVADPREVITIALTEAVGGERRAPDRRRRGRASRQSARRHRRAPARAYVRDSGRRGRLLGRRPDPVSTSLGGAVRSQI